MILFNKQEISATRAAQNIIWLYGAQWSAGVLQDVGIEEEVLLDTERYELVEQLEKQENRVKGLFGF